MLFALYCVNISLQTDSACLKYAGDIRGSHSVRSPNDVSSLQNKLYRLSEWKNYQLDNTPTHMFYPSKEACTNEEINTRGRTQAFFGIPSSDNQTWYKISIWSSCPRHCREGESRGLGRDCVYGTSRHRAPVHWRFSLFQGITGFSAGILPFMEFGDLGRQVPQIFMAIDCTRCSTDLSFGVELSFVVSESWPLFYALLFFSMKKP